jgi:hypothetical protein
MLEETLPDYSLLSEFYWNSLLRSPNVMGMRYRPNKCDSQERQKRG